MVTKRSNLLILLVGMSAALIGQDFEKLLYSRTLNDTVSFLYREIGNMDDDTINLLVLLDGDEYFGLASDVLSLYVSDERISSTVVIGLSSTIESRWKYYTPTNSEAFEESDSEIQQLFESSGKFELYASFVEEELIRSLEKKMGKSFNSNTIFGHSMGGLAAIGFLVQANKLFENYIVASPSVLWDNYHVLEKLDGELEDGKKPYDFNKMYLSIAENDMGNYEEDLGYLKEYLDELKKTDDCQIFFKKYENETHMTVGLKSLFDGILVTMMNN